MRYSSILIIIIGIWLTASGFILGFNEVTIALWSNIVIGIIIVILAFFDISKFYDKEQKQDVNGTKEQIQQNGQNKQS